MRHPSAAAVEADVAAIRRLEAGGMEGGLYGPPLEKSAPPGPPVFCTVFCSEDNRSVKSVGCLKKGDGKGSPPLEKSEVGVQSLSELSD